jgi:hypothetical protein
MTADRRGAVRQMGVARISLWPFTFPRLHPTDPELRS